MEQAKGNDMNEADRKALEEHHKDTEGCSRSFRSGFTHGFIAGCEWRDSQPSETNINKQMKEALEEAKIWGLPPEVERQIEAALEAATPK